MNKRLYKSGTNRQLAGVCAGVAEYFNIDPTIVRVGYVFLTIITWCFPAVLAYIVLAVVMPNKSEVK
jgi:phage shock protein C